LHTLVTSSNDHEFGTTTFATEHSKNEILSYIFSEQKKIYSTQNIYGHIYK
jgi:hypothetical protein